MKAIIRTFAMAALVLSGCAVANQYSVGMTEEEFKKVNSNERIVGLSGNNTVYLLPGRDGQRAQYVYFKNGILSSVDQGVPRADVVIQNK